jgi:lipid-A-disaccharide synthase
VATPTLRLFVCAGEASGDQLAAALVTELRARGPVDAFGLAGPAGRAAGIRAIARTEDVQAMGIAEIVPQLPRLARILRRLVAAAREARPDRVLTIDSPDLMARIGQRTVGVAPRLHWVAPQVWAWRPHRLRTLRRAWDEILCLLPFEPAILRVAGFDATFVGHPAATAPPAGPRDPALVALAPGSRPSELGRLWPVLRQVGVALRRRRPDLRFVVPVASTTEVPQGFDAQWVRGVAAAAHAGVAVTASGTATLEWAAAGVPQVAIYAVNPVSWALARRLVHVPGISLPSVLMGKRAVPEFIQDLPPEAIAEAALALLGPAGAAQVQALSSSIHALDGGRAIAKAADRIMAPR